MSHITLAIANDTDPGLDPSAGDVFRAINPAPDDREARGKNEFLAVTYPVDDPDSRWMQQVPCSKEGVGTFTMGPNVKPGTLVVVWLMRGSDFRRTFIGMASFRAG